MQKTYLRLASALLASVLFTGTATTLFAQSSIGSYEFDVPHEGKRYRLPIKANVDPFSFNPRIEHLVYSVHGYATCGQGSLQVGALLSAKQLVVGHEDDTLIIGPDFNQPTCTSELQQIMWEGVDKWREGYQASAYELDGSITRLEGVTSFDIADRVIAHVAESGLFPNLRSVVAMGFSAGGQHISRYSPGTQIERRLKNLRVRYIIVSPSTYLYMKEYRLDPSSRSWYVPNDADYPGYNDYKHGLDNLNPYLSRSGRQAILSAYPGRDVVYAIGDRDTGTGGLERDYKANLQGANRYVRALNYYQHIEDFFPGHEHSLVVVAGGFHSSYDMYGSGELAPEIFDFAAEPNVVNGFVAFAPDPRSYQFVDGGGDCPAAYTGRFRFNSRLSNIGDASLVRLGIQVRQLTNGSLLNTVRGLKGTGEHYPLQSGAANVARNATVTLGGAPFFEGGWWDGIRVPVSSLVDGVFLLNGQQWNRGAVWWDATDGLDRYIQLDLNRTHEIRSFVVQADNNDAYELYYRHQGSDTWRLAWSVPNYDIYGGGMQTRPNPDLNAQRHILAQPIATDALLLRGDQSNGDRLFSVSEIQAFDDSDPYEDGVLSPGESLIVPFEVCLKSRNAFRLVVDVTGDFADGGPQVAPQ